MEITSNTNKLAILGNPISHSLSPQMHNYISEKLNLDYVYTAFCVERDKFSQAISAVRTLNFSGMNITSPFKFEALELMDVLSDEARRYGSVNTCVNKNGKLCGYNTDADGFYRSLLRAGTDVKGRDILVIGAGGAAQPIGILCADMGAKSISIQNRTKDAAKKLADYIKNTSDFEADIGINKRHYDIVINTTVLGMHPYENECPIADMSIIDGGTFVCDLIYNPEKTVLLHKAEQNGASILNGLGMLIYQGMIAYELFTGVKLDNSIFDDILENVFKRH